MTLGLRPGSTLASTLASDTGVGLPHSSGLGVTVFPSPKRQAHYGTSTFSQPHSGFQGCSSSDTRGLGSWPQE